MANVLLLMSDEHNPLVSSVHGHPAVRTPNMERLAQTGAVYRNTYCTSPLCLPSRSSFMCGKWVHQLQTYSNCNVNLNPAHPAYGAVLAQQGVHTALIGKTDVHDAAGNLGFSEIILSGDRDLPGDTNHRRNPLAIRQGAAGRADGFGPRENAFSGDLKRVDAALEWLRKTAPGLDRPWVLTVNISNPHFPQYVTQDLWDLYPDGGDLPAHGPECASAGHPYARDLRAHFETDRFTEDQIRGLRRGYLGCVTFVDQQLGRLMDALGETGQQDDTAVIYTSDHGDMLGKFGMWWKCSLYEDSARVPCIAAGPGFGCGQTVHTPVTLLDVQAALFRAVDARRPADWAGVPLQDIPRNDPERVAFSEYHGHGARASAYMIRQGKWKYIHCVAAPNLLFDLEEDPDELKNLAESRPEIATRMETELRNICDPNAENDRAEAFIQRQLERILP